MNLVISMVSFAVLLQAAEHFWLQRILAKQDPWQSRYPVLFQMALGAQLFAVIVTLIYPLTVSIFAMWLVCLMTAVRYHGSFNGGSDGMTFHMLSAILWASLWPEFSRAAMAYIGILVTLSYFVAGVSKARHREWWTGQALISFLTKSNAVYPSPLTRAISMRPVLARVISLFILGFEIAFPIAVLLPTTTVAFLAIGAVFHLGNFLVFGLNRFFWIWLAGYPAVLFLSRRFESL